MPLSGLLGVEPVGDPDRTEVRARLAWREDLCTANGLMHGGALMALADCAAGVCAFLNLPDGATTATVESKTNLLAAITSGTVIATATPLHTGAMLIVVETEVRREDGRLAAKTIQTQAILRG